MPECARCLLPDARSGVTLDGEGICDRCRYWDANGASFADAGRLGRLLDGRIESTRGRFPYDALVGLSGGKDSTYVLYHLVRNLGLRVLAFTFDNGFLSEHGRRNIEVVVGRLGVEHFFHRPDWETHRAFYLAALRKFGDPCIGCPFPGTFTATRICYERRIPFFVHGRTRYQMLRNFFEGSRDVSIPQIEAGLDEHSFEGMHALNVELDRRARAWLEQIFDDETERRRAYDEFFQDPARTSSDFAPEHVALFLYLPYDEERIKRTLELETGYTRPASDGLLGHGDCEIHDASSHLFQRIHGMNPVALEVAAMLRHGELSREEGRAIIEREEARARDPASSISRLCDGLGIDRREIDGIVKDIGERGRGKFDCH